MYIAIKPTIALKTNISLPKSNTKLCPQKLLIQSRVRCFVGEEVERQYQRFIPLYRDLSFSPLSLSSLGGGGGSSQYGAYGLTTLERPNADMSQKSPSKSSVGEPNLDNGGGGIDDAGGSEGGVGGGNGGGGGAGGDDDDYWLNDDNPDEPSGIFRSRVLVPEVFDRETLNAILKEWMKTMKDLPIELQQACKIGALSSAKLMRFLLFNTRPTFIRLFTRILPHELSRDFTKKIMADPSLPYKLCFEAVFSLASSLWLEDEDYCKRGWPLVLTNAVTNATCNVFFVWSLAPKKVFENSPRQMQLQRRALSFFRKAVVFFALGFTAKASAQVISQDKKISIASMSKEALAAGLSLGLISNLRYHLISGIDRRLQLHFDVPQVSLAFCLALRFVNVAIGSTQSLNWQVRPSEEVIGRPLVHSLLSPVGDASGVNWFDFKNAIVTGFGLVDTSTQTPPAVKRKRMLRKQKVRANI